MLILLRLKLEVPQVNELDNFLKKMNFSKEVIDFLSNLPEHIIKQTEFLSDSNIQLSSYGWYIPYIAEPKLIGELIKLLERGEINELDSRMVSFIDNCLSFYEELIYKKFPERQQIFQQIFEAHNTKKFYLTVPAIYSQLDGMAENKIGTRLFKNQSNPKKASVKSYISDLGNDFTKKYLGSWTGQNEQNRNQNPTNVSGANRSDILHGTSTNYGTHVNSCKALSVLFLLMDTILK